MRFFKALAMAVSLVVANSAMAGVTGKEVTYRAGDTTLKGYLAVDEAISGKRPAVIVVHEWWGHNDYVRERARMLAEMGYTALALDMYGDGKQADHPEDAGKFAGEVKKNMPAAEARFQAAIEVLKNEPTVDGERLAAIGYCFGGSVVLDMARRGLPLDAVASFHGSLGTSNPAQPGSVMGKVVVMNGADDPFVKPEAIEAFRNEMDAAGVDYEFINYPGAVHSFTNPGADATGQKFGLPLAYNQEADEKSWNRMKALFDETIGK
jgi:dienelactone hydrolase